MTTEKQFAVGQRLLSNTETELGLGAIMKVDFRSIEILFPATGEARTYTKQDAPLTRLTFSVGDTVKSQDGWSMSVDHIEESQGVFIYAGFREDTKEPVTLPEMFLDHHIRLNQPEQRLFSMQLDHPKWFDLRLDAHQFRHQHAQSNTLGMVGARIALIPHQLHIASEVGRRYAPRVLLADEVGLGKTIEAALIIHQQILTGRASRVLILVPDTLLHQWLVEMLRRVNLAFAIFDESRCAAIEDDNPFEQEQLVLCGLNWLESSPKRQQQLVEAGWDLLVVDEAHHLSWSEEAPSEAYQLVEQLANTIPGVLLLTATPDQLGHQSHFARLRLLDAARFHNYEVFLNEEGRYSELAEAVAPLIEGEAPSQEQIETLSILAPEIMAQHSDLSEAETREQLLHQLIDCHGTGRVLFRNRRASISGFPKRSYHAYPLALPDCYQSVVQGDDLTLALYPERAAHLSQVWLEEDPRVEWLLSFLPTIKPEKVLLICASAATAQELAEIIRVKTGIRQAVFHEGMSIVERDKAAHYFAQEEEGAQILLCSEIGSEGRNFQFAHHLVLFDLPLTPDLLEQRIGRLDRIGQQHDIDIHVPALENSAQAVLADWYHKGLNAFEQTCPTGAGVFEEVKTTLLGACLRPDDENLCDELITQSAALNATLKAKLDEGRDRLLELNASGAGKVDGLIEDIIEQDNAHALPQFMGRLLDAIGVQQEEKGNDCFILMPTESMVSPLPGLDPEGMTVTYSRRVATTLEHVHFLTWDHPLVHTAIDVVLTDVLGKSSMGFIKDKSLPTGAYWLEIMYTLAAQAPSELQLGRFLPPTPIRLCINPNGDEMTHVFDIHRPVGKKIAHQLVQALQQPITQQLEKASKLAHNKANRILHDAIANMHEELGNERQRLKDLQQQNPAIRDSEISFIDNQIAELDKVLQQADVELEAIRIVVNNP